MDRLLLVILFFPQLLSALSAPASLQVDPKTIAFDCVNVITGSYQESRCDLAVNCIEPLDVSRVHVSNDRIDGKAGVWRMLGERVCIKKEEGGRQVAYLEEANGTVIKFVQDSISLNFFPKLGKGTCNTRGSVSGRTNLKNYRMKGRFEHRIVTVTTGSGEKRIYTHVPSEEELAYHPKPVNARFYVLSSIEKPNGNKIETAWGDWEVLQPGLWGMNVSVTAAVPPLYETLGWVKYAFKRDRYGATATAVTASNGLSCNRVELIECAGHHSKAVLKEIGYPSGYLESYVYDRGTANRRYLFAISERCQPNNRRLRVSYYKLGHQWAPVDERHFIRDRNDPIYGRVRCLEAPVGNSEKYVEIAWFRYRRVPWHEDLTERLKLQGETDVFDCCGGRTRYLHQPGKRIEAVERFLGDRVGSRERFVWGSGEDEGQLIGHIFEEGNGILLKATTFNYDERGNVLEETLWGDLTGASEVAVELDATGMPIDNGAENYTRRFKYDELNRVIEAEDGCVTKRYTYSRDCVSSELVYVGGELRERHFSDYTWGPTLVFEASDNGSDKDRSSLEGVTEREVTRYRSKQFPGYPTSIKEAVWDPDTRTEEPLRFSELWYTEQHKIASTSTSDPSGRELSSNKFTYNHRGQLLEEIDALGQATIREYDLNGNCVLLQTPRSDYETRNTYDFANRLVSTIRVYSDGSRASGEHSCYDYLGRMTATTDYAGRETLYDYDEMGRCIAEHRPPVMTEDGWERPVIGRTYDALDRCVSETNGRGETIRRRYTARGEIAQIDYPDGTFEKYQYALDGKLISEQDRNGTVTRYEKDYLDRVISRTRVSNVGEVLSFECALYKGSRKVEETDPEGHTTYFRYSAAGQVIEQVKGDARTTWQYDALGRKTREEVWSSPSAFVATCWSYDPLGRVVSEWQEDNGASLIGRVDYDYDGDGNVTVEKRYVDENRCATTRWTYDPLGRVTLEIDPLGNETRTFYDSETLPEAGSLLVKTVVDAKGNGTITYHDGADNTVFSYQKDPFGQLIAVTQFQYDLAYNQTRSIHHQLEAGDTVRTLVCAWEYGPMGRAVALYEALSSPQQRVTRFQYNAAGQLEKTTKPSGAELFRSYDSFGRLATYVTEEVTYVYEYDRNGNLLSVRSEQGSTYKKYDGQNRLISETLESGLTVSNSYDGTGRRCAVHFSDQSTVNYSYAKGQLSEVKRYDRDGKHLYTHSYLAYNLLGQPVKEERGGQAGSLLREYDALGRPTEILSSASRHRVLAYDELGNVLDVETDSQPTSYSYDSLQHLVGESGELSHSYQFDSLHNRVEKDGVPFHFNDLNQLISYGERRLKYDANGCLVENGDTSYRYDSLDRLVEVETSQFLARFTYDAFHRRLSKEVYIASDSGWELESSYRFLYTGKSEVGAVNELGEIFEFRVLGFSTGAEIGAAVAIELRGDHYFPVHDHVGNVAILQDNNGEVVTAYTYSAYGEYEAYAYASFFCPWAFMSKRVDDETGLVLFGRRFYDPDLGRWITPDPRGYQEGPNLYAYCVNRPLAMRDLWGEAAESDWATPMIAGLQRGIERLREMGRRFAEGFKTYVFGGCSGGELLEAEEGHPICGPIRLYNGGIGTTKEQTQEMVNRLSADLHEHVFGIANPSYGLLADICRAALVRLGILHPVTPCAREEVQALLTRFPDRDIHWCAFSEGTLIQYQTAIYWNAGEQGRIHMRSFGGPKLLAPTLAATVHNFSVPGDPVAAIAGDPRKPGRRLDNVSIIRPKMNPRPSFRHHRSGGDEYYPVILREYQLMRAYV